MNKHSDKNRKNKFAFIFIIGSILTTIVIIGTLIVSIVASETIQDENDIKFDREISEIKKAREKHKDEYVELIRIVVATNSDVKHIKGQVDKLAENDSILKRYFKIIAETETK